MKILHISNNYAPVGGAEYYVFNVCNELEKRGHENIIICANQGLRQWQRHNRKVFAIEKVTARNGPIKEIDKALAIIRRESPDIIYLHIVNNAALIERVLCLRPTIKYVHNHDIYCASGMISNRLFKCREKLSFFCCFSCAAGNCIGCKPFNALKQFKAARANLKASKKLFGLIASCDYVKQNLINNGVSENKIYMIPYFVEPKANYPQSEYTDTPEILFAGRICKAKGPDYLIKALTYIRYPYKLVIAGDGYYMDYVKKLAEKLKVDKNIEFTGWLVEKELEAVYRRASIVVMPSIWQEPFGTFGIEAMSYAKPVVAFDTGGISQWLMHEETGFLVPPRNIHLLAEGINKLLKNPELGKSFGENGKREFYEKFSPDVHMAELEKVFNKAIG